VSEANDSNELLGLGPRFVVMYPTFNNEFFHSLRYYRLAPLFTSERFYCRLIFPLRNHCVFIRCPFGGLKNRHREKACGFVYNMN